MGNIEHHRCPLLPLAFSAAGVHHMWTGGSVAMKLGLLHEVDHSPPLPHRQATITIFVHGTLTIMPMAREQRLARLVQLNHDRLNAQTSYRDNVRVLGEELVVADEEGVPISEIAREWTASGARTTKQTVYQLLRAAQRRAAGEMPWRRRKVFEDPE